VDVQFIQAFCTKLPAVTEDIKWDNDLVFSIGSKMFCVVSLEPPFTCSFKVLEEEFEHLSQKDGFIPAPYMARAKWVQVIAPDKLSKKEWEHFINQSYNLVKDRLTKKLKLELGIL
jgi:predicted DNA-binding protein (MmcQ/YjbR family)